MNVECKCTVLGSHNCEQNCAFVFGKERSCELTRELQIASGSKIVMLVIDVLGELSMETGGLTKLEVAQSQRLA